MNFIEAIKTRNPKNILKDAIVAGDFETFEIALAGLNNIGELLYFIFLHDMAHFLFYIEGDTIAMNTLATYFVSKSAIQYAMAGFIARDCPRTAQQVKLFLGMVRMLEPINANVTPIFFEFPRHQNVISTLSLFGDYCNESVVVTRNLIEADLPLVDKLRALQFGNMINTGTMRTLAKKYPETIAEAVEEVRIDFSYIIDLLPASDKDSNPLNILTLLSMEKFDRLPLDKKRLLSAGVEYLSDFVCPKFLHHIISGQMLPRCRYEAAVLGANDTYYGSLINPNYLISPIIIRDLNAGGWNSPTIITKLVESTNFIKKLHPEQISSTKTFGGFLIAINSGSISLTENIPQTIRVNYIKIDLTPNQQKMLNEIRDSKTTNIIIHGSLEDFKNQCSAEPWGSIAYNIVNYERTDILDYLFHNTKFGSIWVANALVLSLLFCSSRQVIYILNKYNIDMDALEEGMLEYLPSISNWSLTLLQKHVKDFHFTKRFVELVRAADFCTFKILEQFL